MHHRLSLTGAIVLKTSDQSTAAGAADLALAVKYDAIVQRLQLHYPTLDALEIRIAVEEVARQFDDAPLQPFVPLLVEKLARDRCHELADRQTV